MNSVSEIVVSFQGIAGSFSHLAACNVFGKSIVPLGTTRFLEIFENVAAGRAAFGVVPIENSLAGSIYENFDLLHRFKLPIVAEYVLDVHHCLLSVPRVGISFEDRVKSLKRVLSHQKALEQCVSFFEAHPWIERAVHSDTAGAAKTVHDLNDPLCAAIASKEAADLYGLEVLRAHIEDDASNQTRFLIINQSSSPLAGPNKCSISFSLPHTPQSLMRALGVISQDNINVTKIESRPIKGAPFEYIFYVDFEFPPTEQALVQTICKNLEGHTHNLCLLGLYAAHSLP